MIPRTLPTILLLSALLAADPPAASHQVAAPSRSTAQRPLTCGAWRLPGGAYLRSMKRQLALQQRLAGSRANLLFGVLKDARTPEERDALRFLLAYSPLSDLADRDGAYFLRAARMALRARREMPWGKAIPPDLFRHFVLPPRVNNENLDEFRSVCYSELAERVGKLSLRQAVLEVNHWCREHVIYQGTDARTSAPLALMKTGWGRCGEESTFTVNALRTVGIPARQCYTPRWAHTDDNHAWVEVWVDGAWHYLGACEPEPDLDLAWFREPVRRAMLVHTRAFGLYKGDEPVLTRSPRHAILNLTAHYTPVASLEARILDPQGHPVPGAEVSFRLFNYCEFYPLSTVRSDSNGSATLTAGLGDLLVWARKNGRYGFARATVGEGNVDVALDHGPGDSFALDLDLAPPVERPPLPVPSTGTEDNARRLKQEDGMRAAHAASFPDQAHGRELAEELGMAPDGVWSALHRSTGNWQEIEAFLQRTPASQRPWALPLLGTLSDKDLRDTPADILLDHLSGALTAAGDLSRTDKDLFVEGVLAPRVGDELLVPWRSELRSLLGQKRMEEALRDPESLVRWVAHAVVRDDEANAYRCPLTPRGAMELRRADGSSRNVLLVALFRAIGIPARLHPATRIPQIWRKAWTDTPLDSASEAKETPHARILIRAEGADADALYGSQFTLARLEDGVPTILEYEEGRKAVAFTQPLDVPAGDYLQVSATRQPGGTVLARLRLFPAPAAQEVPAVISLRREPTPLQPITRLPPMATLQRAGQAPLSLSDLTREKGLVLAWLEPGKEPTRHVLAEVAALRESFEAWGGPIAWIVPEGTTPADLGLDRLPGTAFLACDPEGRLLAALRSSRCGMGGSSLPVVVVCDKEGAVLHLSAGYTIGSGERILTTLKRIQRGAR